MGSSLFHIGMTFLNAFKSESFPRPLANFSLVSNQSEVVGSLVDVFPTIKIPVDYLQFKFFTKCSSLSWYHFELAIDYYTHNEINIKKTSNQKYSKRNNKYSELLFNERHRGKVRKWFLLEWVRLMTKV